MEVPYYAIGDYSNASYFLSTLPQNSEELVNFKNFYDFMIYLAGEERNIFQLEGEEIGFIQSLASSNTSITLAVQGILALVNDESLSEQIERIEEGQENTLTLSIQEKEKKSKRFGENLTVFPNPSDLAFWATYKLEKDISEKPELILYDIAGKILFNKVLYEHNGTIGISTENLSDGIYFLQLNSGTRLLSSCRIIVLH